MDNYVHTRTQSVWLTQQVDEAHCSTDYSLNWIWYGPGADTGGGTGGDGPSLLQNSRRFVPPWLRPSRPPLFEQKGEDLSPPFQTF